MEVVFKSLSADSVLETRNSITNADGEYRLAVTERPLYQVGLMKDGKPIELLEISLRHRIIDSVGFVVNFGLPYFEPDEDYYRRNGWPSLYFDAYRATLRPHAKAILDTMATILRNEPRLRMIVEGHADPLEAPINQRSKQQYPEHLGQQRALAAARYLREHGVPDSCISSISYGGRRPAAPSDSPETRRFNRRVEVKAVYIKGVENGYGHLKVKFADLLKDIPRQPKEEAQMVSKPVSKTSMKSRAALPKSDRRVSGAGRPR